MACRCFRPSIVVDPPPSCEGCLQLASYIQGCGSPLLVTTAQFPQTNSFNVYTDGDLSACVGCEPVLSVISNSAGITIVSIDQVTGEIEFSIASTVIDRAYVVINYRIDCVCLNTSAMGSLQICTKNLCRPASGLISCGGGQFCNPDTGLCE